MIGSDYIVILYVLGDKLKFHFDLCENQSGGQAISNNEFLFVKGF